MNVIGLVVGSAQFGMAYGVAGTGKAVGQDEVRRILEIAANAGVRVIDTAPAYGDIEQRLGMLCAGLPFSFVSKISAFPPGLSDSQICAFVATSIASSLHRLGNGLDTLLFHRAEDLLCEHGDRAWRMALDLIPPNVRLGVSCYSPEEACTVRQRYPLQVVQLPGSAVDQRIRPFVEDGAMEGIEIHLRSVFLQGLLVMNTELARQRVPASEDVLCRWSDWCSELGKNRISAAFSVARGLPGVNSLVVGLDSAEQAEQIVAAWSASVPCYAPELASSDLNVIDPRRWVKI